MAAETVVVIVGILTLVVICYQTFLLFAQLRIMRKQHDIVNQLGLKADLRIGLESDEPIRNYSPAGNPPAYRVSLYLINDGTKPANACHVKIMLPVKWHEASANAKSKFKLNRGDARVDGADYFEFDFDIDTINAEDHQSVMNTAFSGTPGAETVLWTVASSEGNFPTDGFGKLTVRLG